jgi:phosphopantothenoylcysteine decarboxylase/phosphopantothenate--cysteine ligase
MVIAPATANVINKIAHGIADDALTTTFCAMRKPVVIAPAMNDKMYLSPATQASLQTLSEWENITLLDCASGELACGTTGRGRMQEVNIIAETIEYALTEKKLQNKQILITAGPTQEQLDPVRYISNYSTGKMGYALARACLMQGADVSLVSGPTNLQVLSIPLFLQEKQVHLYNVCSAQEMYLSCETIFPKADITILCAAVADFTPTNIADKKIKKESGQTEMTLSLSTTVDIAATLGAKKRDNQIVVGFALETDHEKEHALAKMQKKNLNFIVLNSLRDSGAGFGHDTNKVTILSNDGEEKNFPLMSKEEVAQIIVSHTLLP